MEAMDVKTLLWYGVLISITGAYLVALSGVRSAKQRDVTVHSRRMIIACSIVGIWLVAQIYHIDEYYPNAFIVWGLGALALAWAMPSIAQGLMAVLLVFLWGSFEVFGFSSPNYPGPWVVLLGVLPLAWLQRSRALLFFALVAFIALYAFSTAQVADDLLAGTLFYCAILYIAAGRLSTRSAFPDSAPVFPEIGRASCWERG